MCLEPRLQEALEPRPAIQFPHLRKLEPQKTEEEQKQIPGKELSGHSFHLSCCFSLSLEPAEQAWMLIVQALLWEKWYVKLGRSLHLTAQ